MSLPRHFSALEMSLSPFLVRDPFPLGNGELAGTSVMRMRSMRWLWSVRRSRG